MFICYKINLLLTQIKFLRLLKARLFTVEHLKNAFLRLNGLNSFILEKHKCTCRYELGKGGRNRTFPEK